MDMLRTARTYATRENAAKRLAEVLAASGRTLDDTRYLIATNDSGRFAPVLVGAEMLAYVHVGVTVVG